MKFNIHICTGKKQSIVKISNFKMKRNQINIVFGESGIGKSLIHQAIYGILDSKKFKISITPALSESAFYVFQEPSSHLNPAMLLKDQLSEGNISENLNQSSFFSELFSRSNEKNFLSIFPKTNQPSGGEKQRIHLLMALKRYQAFIQSSEKHRLFIFDEATAHLDQKNRDRFLLILLECFKKKKTSISIITHDYTIVDFFATQQFQPFYTELKLKNRSIVQQRFDDKEYLRRMNGLHKIKIRDTESSQLRMKSGIEIFNFSLHFFLEKKEIDLNIKKAQIIYLKSESGGGKSTVSNILMGISQAKSVQFSVGDQNFTEKSKPTDWKKYIWGKKISMIFQNADDVLNQLTSVYDTLNTVHRMSQIECLTHLKQLFSSINLEFLTRKIKSLSGGQKQRINILRSLLIPSPILILDEPLKGLDFDSIQAVLELIINLQKAGKSMLLISHHEQIFDRLIPKEHWVELQKIT